MTPRARPTANVAVDAAGLLRRVGFLLLVVAAPVFGLVSRRGVVIAVPMGMALMLMATLVETEGREPARKAWQALTSVAGGLAVFLLFWAALSLLWTPFPGEAMERVANLSGIGLMGLLAACSVPERMRASNLYLLPVGMGLVALLAIGVELRGTFSPLARLPDIDQSLLERGLLLLVLLAPAAVSWLISRERLLSAFLLVAAVTAALVIGQAFAALIALAIGAVVFALATIVPAAGRWFCLVVIPGLVLLAPAIPFVMRPLSKLVFGITHPKVETIRTWGRVVTDDPVRLITGHGLDTALRARLAGLVPIQAPSGLLFEVWFELGFLGAIALALLLARGVLGSARLHPGAAPGALMTLAVAFSLAVMGQGAAQAWWLMGLAVAAVAVLAVDHGQYRTTRPRSRDLRR
jgi:hypothetical protein